MSEPNEAVWIALLSIAVVCFLFVLLFPLGFFGHVAWNFVVTGWNWL